MSWRLVPDDEDFALLYRRAEDLLQGLARVEQHSALETRPWLPPPPLADGAALSALERIGKVLRQSLDAFRTPPIQPAHSVRQRLFSLGRQRLPLRVVWMPRTDIELLAAALRQINLALSPADRKAVNNPDLRRRLDDLAVLLDGFVPDPDLWQGTIPGCAELLRPLARLTALVDLAADDDTAVPLDALQTDPDADVDLTSRQAAAYEQVTDRINLLLTDGDPLHRFLF
jgi:hypothetical protein